MPEFPVSGPISATVRISAGSLRFVAEQRDSVVVDLRPGNSSDTARQAAAETIVEMTADGLIVETPQARGFIVRRSPSVDVTVRLPTDSRIMARTASADVTVDGRLASADVNTASGDLRIEHVAGDLRRHSASGDTQFRRIDGALNADGASGDVRGGVVGGDLTSKSASGDVTVEAVGGSVRATSASGDFHLGNVARGQTNIHSASGDVVIGVAEGTAVWMDVSTISGDTRSELNVSDNSPTESGATLELGIRTISGDVVIRRATSAPAQPSAAQPSAAQPSTAQPSTTQPSTAQPSTAQPGPAADSAAVEDEVAD
jgi:Putative adhesin